MISNHVKIRFSSCNLLALLGRFRAVVKELASWNYRHQENADTRSFSDLEVRDSAEGESWELPPFGKNTAEEPSLRDLITSFCPVS